MTSVISYSNFLLVISLLFSTPLTRKHLQRTHSVLFFKLDSQASIALISLHTAMWGQTFWNFIKRHIVVCLPFLSKLRFETNDFFTAANNNVRNKQRPDKGFIIESTVTLFSGASLGLIKDCSLVVMGDNDNLNRAVTLDQTGMLPWQRGSEGLQFMWRM